MDEDLVNKISKAYSLGNAKDMLDFTKFSINLQYGGETCLPLFLFAVQEYAVRT